MLQAQSELSFGSSHELLLAFPRQLYELHIHEVLTVLGHHNRWPSPTSEGFLQRGNGTAAATRQHALNISNFSCSWPVWALVAGVSDRRVDSTPVL